ncbi:Recombinational DNA repair protein RecT (prophage associated) [Lactococcus lactis subsp. lactis]|uniref:Recombinational DNA repair protein RecT (Prophage associated) n=1 Tax=Lactococcus lactis subsp. lactis TaxID=1360 RepID=A0A0V8E0T5_LACLL|nr:recombinase RecT [Lactococcus lactis]KSU19463.1 Recombinational DNA repair protein RecT (prophage associated) [Lactococcus lactis subsp. lactis]
MATEISNYLKQDNIMQQLSETLGRNSAPLVTSALTAIANNYQLKDATPVSVYTSLMKAAALNLTVDPNLGFAYLVPYKRNFKENGQWVNVTEAQLQIGYKGLVQLALRSGQIKSVNTGTIYESEFKGYNKITGEFIIDETIIPDEDNDEVAGYFAYVQLVNGGEVKQFSRKKQIEHFAKKYSKAYSYDLDNNKKSSPWSTEFNAMAEKTVLKQVLKFVPMSLEMQEAVSVDENDMKWAKRVDEVTGLEIPDQQQIENFDKDDYAAKKMEELKAQSQNKEPKEVTMEDF